MIYSIVYISLQISKNVHILCKVDIKKGLIKETLIKETLIKYSAHITQSDFSKELYKNSVGITYIAARAELPF